MPVFTANIPGELKIGDRIEIGGKIKKNARKMSVNLCAQEGEEPRDVVLHFDVRFHRDNIISLSRKNGLWIGSGNYDTNYNMFVPELRQRKVQRRRLRDAYNTFELPDSEFEYLYRINKDMGMNLIQQLNGSLRPTSVGGIPVHVQVADADSLILNVNAQFPGRVHDAFIFRQSVVREEMCRLHEQQIGRLFLLGHSGYGMELWLMTPVLRAAPHSPEDRYTQLHCRARNVMEECTMFRIIFEVKDTDVITIYCQGKFHSNFLPKIPLSMAKYIVAWADIQRITHCYFHMGAKQQVLCGDQPAIAPVSPRPNAPLPAIGVEPKRSCRVRKHPTQDCPELRSSESSADDEQSIKNRVKTEGRADKFFYETLLCQQSRETNKFTAEPRYRSASREGPMRPECSRKYNENDHESDYSEMTSKNDFSVAEEEGPPGNSYL